MIYLNFDSRTVPGELLIDLASELPFGTPKNEHPEYANVLESLCDMAQGVHSKTPPEPLHKTKCDQMVCEQLQCTGTEHYSPYYSFLITNSLIESIWRSGATAGARLSPEKLLRLSLHASADAVRPEFSSDAINAINTSYYASGIAFDPSARLATMFATNQPINIALGSLMTRSMGGHKGRLRIKELASSTKTSHWTHIAQGLQSNGVKHMELTLTDFIMQSPSLGAGLANQFTDVSTETYSLLDDMPMLPEEDRYNILITTYGFDSVWQAEDLCLTRVNDQWYKNVYRVKVADWAPRKRELLEALRQGKALPDAAVSNYDCIAVETAMMPVDVSDMPYGQYIHKRGRSRINFPGGLIKRVINAYETQLQKNGICIIGDTANFGFDTNSPYGPGDSDRRVSGVAARYKVEDYVLAKQILESEHGLTVDLISLSELLAKYLPGKHAQLMQPDIQQRYTHQAYNGIMVVKRTGKYTSR